MSSVGGAGGVFQPLPLGDAPRPLEGNHSEGVPGLLFPALLLVDADLAKDLLLSLPSPGRVRLAWKGNAPLKSGGPNGPGNANSPSNSPAGNDSRASITPFIGVAAAGGVSARAGLRVRVERQAPGRILPSPVANMELGLTAGKAFFATPLPLPLCRSDGLRLNGVLGEAERGKVNPGGACMREDDLDLSCNSVSSNT